MPLARCQPTLNIEEPGFRTSIQFLREALNADSLGRVGGCLARHPGFYYPIVLVTIAATTVK
jgi:hypothetical protein